MSELSVATFNIRFRNLTDGAHGWRHRRESTLRQLSDLDVDVCGMQEVLQDQRTFLERGLPDAQWYGVGRNDGRSSGEQSPILVRPGRLEVTSWRTLWLSEQPARAGSKGWDAKIPRVATVLLATCAGVRIGIVNTHFDHCGRQAQVESARLIADVARGRREIAGVRAGIAAEPPQRRRWIIMGDFNVELASAAMRELSHAGLRSVLPDDATGTFHGFTGATDRQRIDHILVDDGFDVLDAQILHQRPGGRLPSDHWPVVARLRMR